MRIHTLRRRSISILEILLVVAAPVPWESLAASGARGEAEAALQDGVQREGEGAAREEDAPPDHPPIALWSDLPRTPVETAGTGLAPSVDVVVTVAPTGSVREVEVRQVRPSTRHDGVVAAAVREAIGAWKFAPALRDGVAVSAELSWTVELPAVEDDTAVQFDFVRGSVTGLVEEERVAENAERALRIFTLPVDAQRDHLERVAARAERFLKKDGRTTAENDWFVLVTDVADERFAKAMLNNLSFSYGFVGNLLSSHVAPQPSKLRTHVYVYRDRLSYIEFARGVLGMEEPDGTFVPPGVIAFHTSHPTNDEFLRATIHTAVHAYLYRYVARPGSGLPRWLNEGFAEYVSASELKDGQLIPGSYRASDRYRGPGRSTTEDFKGLVAAVVQGLKRGKGFDLQGVLSAGPAVYWGHRSRQHFAQSWMLVHYLRHGGDGWDSERFPTFLLYCAEGFPAEDALREVYGPDMEALERGYRKHIGRF